MANEDKARITGGGYTINLEVTSLAHGMDKQLMIFPIPSKGGSDTTTFLIDLQRCKEAVTIQGYILPSSGSSGLSQAKQLIQLMRKTATNLKLTWGSDFGQDLDDASNYETITGNIQKCDIKEEAVRVGGYTTGETKAYNVQLVFVRGTKKN